MTYPSKPKPIYDAAISYRTPSGRKVRFGALVAADNLPDCEAELLARLRNSERFGRRKVASIVGEFSAAFVTMQIGKAGSPDPGEMALMLEACRNQFAYYASNHQTKASALPLGARRDDAAHKASVNDMFVQRIQRVLNGGKAGS